MKDDIVWLHWIGTRRPTTLEDQNRYHEQISRPPAEPVAHPELSWVYGESLGRSTQ